MDVEAEGLVYSCYLDNLVSFSIATGEYSNSTDLEKLVRQKRWGD
jgi:hypothetical protein